jgi:hypothetical protein
MSRVMFFKCEDCVEPCVSIIRYSSSDDKLRSPTICIFNKERQSVEWMRINAHIHTSLEDLDTLPCGEREADD